FQREATAALRKWYDVVKAPGGPVKERLIAKFSDEMLTVVRQHYLRLSIDTLLFWRAMSVLDAAILHVWQDLDLMTELRAFFAAYRSGIMDRTLEVLTPETHLTAVVP